MVRFAHLLLILGLIMVITPAIEARPDYHRQFLEDPLRRADSEGCVICHNDTAGGGPRNEFGTAFEDAGLVITPLMRASFLDLFDVPSSSIGERGTIHFSDPDNQIAVVEIDGEQLLIEMPAEALSVAEDEVVEETEVAVNTAPANFSFFVTSVGVGRGGNLGGIGGADVHCQSLAETAGAGTRTWRAYLSTTFEDQPAINAGDRIGPGPWHNIKGMRIARGTSDLHSDYNMLNGSTALTETGEMIDGIGGNPNRHDILTGTLTDGTASDMNCNNWTSDGEGRALLGHFDRQGGPPDSATSWNSAHASQSCSLDDLRATGGDGLFYCFAID